MPTTAANSDARALARRIVDCRSACAAAAAAAKEAKLSTDECYAMLVDATSLAAQLGGLAHYADAEAARAALASIRQARADATDALGKAMRAYAQADLEKCLAVVRQV
jgi:hypothetical protein